MLEQCPPCVTVVPNSFIDGATGRYVKTGYLGVPRIQCLSGGEFQVDQEVFGGCPGGCRPVGANGFNISAKIYQPYTVVNIPAGSTWPPSWWPPQPPAPSTYAPDIPTVNPPWALSADWNPYEWGVYGPPPGPPPGPAPPVGTTPPTPTTLPTPEAGESQSDFMTRCLGVLEGEPDEFDETDATAWCEYSWLANPATASMPLRGARAAPTPPPSPRPRPRPRRR